ncbi:N-acetylmuramoyl-L-alanine amidase [Fodinibius saliphilus]|uniref:N-acetylmuramoyl-L-alanine amidase n=1 Tax=Fodinibius saliphilus TaxID=1920650 RepID=UPI001107B0B1|nr:N-acetylmuramoyl-L-alanine amidase [Fodinibius saliphilus]
MDFRFGTLLGLLAMLLVRAPAITAQKNVANQGRGVANITSEHVKINFDTAGHLLKTSNVVKTQKGLRKENPDKDAVLLSDVIDVPIQQVTPFLALGSRLVLDNAVDQLSAIQIEIRSLDNTQQWSAWREIKWDTHLTDSKDTLVGRLQFLSETIATVQFRLVLKRRSASITGNARLRSLAISFTSPGATDPKRLKEIQEKNKEVTLQKEYESNGKEYPMPDFVSRTDWDCPDGQQPSGPYPLTDVTHQIVHHSAGTNSTDDWPAVVRAIWDYHVNTNGWSDIGYNWLIDPNGIVYQGRGWVDGDDEVQGAHFCGTNSNTMGVCLMGNFEEVAPREEAKKSLSNLLAWKSDEKNIDPLAIQYHSSSQQNLKTISGHRDGCNTLCPGENLYTQLPQIRNRVKELIQESTVPITKVDSVGNYPNPFRGTTNITFSLTESGMVRLTVWNIKGQFIEEVTRRLYSPGSHSELWNATGYASGIYFCRIDFKGQSIVKKMVLVRR